MNYQTEFSIQQLRTQNIIKGIESLTVFVAAVIANMLIPQLLIKYIYDPTTLIEAPVIFEYLPLATYGFAIAYFIFAMVGNFIRERKVSLLEKELTLCSDKCDDGCCSNENDDISDEELKELERIVDEALKPSKTKTASKKKTVKKAAAKKKPAKKSKK